MRAGQHARADAEGRYGSAARARDECRRNARIDRRAAAAVADRTVDHARAPESAGAPRLRHHVTAPARRGQIARRDEHPIGRVVVVLFNDLVGRQRRPADIIAAVAPIDPGRSPFIVRNPEPAERTVVRPAAVVEDHPAPIFFCRIGDPIPAPFVGVDPMAVLVRPPIRRQFVRHPDLAPARAARPMAIRLERFLEFGRDLCGGRLHGAGDRRHGHPRNAER